MITLKKIDKAYYFQRILKSFAWKLFRLMFLLGLTFIIVYPFLTKISSSFMTYKDLTDSTVRFFPKHPTLNNFKLVLSFGHYWERFGNTLTSALICGFFQMISCTMIGYGFAKFRFKGKNVWLILVIATMLIPPQTIITALYLKFKAFDIFHIFALLGIPQIKMIDTPWPNILLSATGLGFKNGLFILMMMQFFKSIPKELNEAAKVDGAGYAYIFIRIMFPLSRTMLVTVFSLAFAWQWTDTFYSKLFFANKLVLSDVINTISTIPQAGILSYSVMASVMVNTATLMVILPLLLFFIFAQRQLVQGIERTGMVE